MAGRAAAGGGVAGRQSVAGVAVDLFLLVAAEGQRQGCAAGALGMYVACGFRVCYHSIVGWRWCGSTRRYSA